MKHAYKFSNLLGTVYRTGNIEFLPKKDTLASPVGNRLTLFNLKENVSETLPVTTKYNIVCIAFSPDCRLAILLDEKGDASLVSLLSKTVVHKFHFRKPVNCVKFNSSGTKFAVAMEKVVLVYHSPGRTREINPFTLFRSYHGAYDEVTHVDWSDNSAAFAVCGKDMSTRLYSAVTNLSINYTLGGHKDEVVGCFFETDTLDMYTVSKDGALNIWECNIDPDEFENRAGKVQSQFERIKYIRLSKFFFNKEGEFNDITSVNYHKRSHILCTGYASGNFTLHELPGFSWIHSLNISEHPVSTVSFNDSGDWIGLACAASGQLLVWEWHSETYVLKQHGHFNNMRCLDYSPDGRYIVTGGEDSKVKVWNSSTGFCFVTFTEHTSGVTAVAFTSNGNVIVSASLDGTVRAFDTNRYRNFRTFTSPEPAQFISLAVDFSGDLICAGSHDHFGIFLWSMQTGRLLDILNGHEGPVTSLAFSSRESLLVSGSWDSTVRMWNVLEGKGARETLQINHDVLDVAFKPDGSEIAVSSLNAEITFWNVQTAAQTGTIECRYDIVAGRGELDRTSSKTNALGKAYDSIAYSADGLSVIAGGKFMDVCIYNVEECLLVKKFMVTQNLSFDASQEFLDRRKMTEFGPAALIDTGEGDDSGIKLPGVQKGDMCSRTHKPEVRVSDILFSPAGRDWAAVTTEGILMYSLDGNSVFNPFDLDIEVKPEVIREKMKVGEHNIAIMMALRLNENDIIQEVVENVPTGAIEVISNQMKLVYVEKLLNFIGGVIGQSRHFQFYIMWLKCLLLSHTVGLKHRQKKIMPVVNALLKKLTVKKEDLGSVCDGNKHQIQCIVALSSHLCSKRQRVDLGMDNSEDPLDSEDSGVGNLF